jgi:methionyl-tRNA formyltransferase
MPERLRVVYAGTPDFAVPALERLIAEGHQVAGVYTQPDRPAGRGRKPRACPVKAAAVAHELPVLQPERIAGPDEQARLANLAPDVMIVAAYGQILPRRVLATPRLGCLNIHASLLPRWRGAAPIQRALLAGDSETGVSLMVMTPGMDTGPVVATRASAIRADDTGGSLHDRLAALGAELMGEPLRAYAAAESVAQPQPEQGVTYAPKLDKAQACVDWGQPAVAIDRQIRAFNPWPVAYTGFRGDSLRLWAAEPVASDVSAEVQPGIILAADREGLTVATGNGALRVTELQPPGKQRQSAAAFVNGYPVNVGDRLGP